MLITEKIEKIKQNCNDIIEGITQSFLKFNDHETNSKQLTMLIKC